MTTNGNIAMEERREEEQGKGKEEAGEEGEAIEIKEQKENRGNERKDGRRKDFLRDRSVFPF